jgi:hypothetical protein
LVVGSILHPQRTAGLTGAPRHLMPRTDDSFGPFAKLCKVGFPRTAAAGSSHGLLHFGLKPDFRFKKSEAEVSLVTSENGVFERLRASRGGMRIGNTGLCCRDIDSEGGHKKTRPEGRAFKTYQTPDQAAAARLVRTASI